MALLTQIGGSGALFYGEDKQFLLEVLDVNSVPVNIAGWAITLMVRLKANTVDPPIFNKAATIQGAYNVVRAQNTQRASVVLSDIEMETVAVKTYQHSWKRMDDGAETILAYGPFVVELATNR